MVPTMRVRMRSAGTEYESPPIIAADVIAFERRFGVAGAALSEPGGLRVEWLCFLGHHALERTGTTMPDFDAVADNLETLAPLFDGDEAEDQRGKAPALNRAQRRGSSRASSANSASPGPTSKRSTPGG